jgi:hypothetical protein
MQLTRFAHGTLPALLLLSATTWLSCGGASSRVGTLEPPPNQETGDGGAGSTPGDGGAGTGGSDVTGGGSVSGGSGGAGGAANPLACADIFDQGALQTYSFDVGADQLAAINTEFHNLAALEAGQDFAVYHPITLHLNGETVNAAIKLHGQSSWDQTVKLDGDHAKMQFDVSFDQVDPMGEFHGVSKLVFDMPRDDWTFMHDRLSQAWLRQSGIMAPCSVNARLNINGSYYGLYVLEQGVGNGTVAAFFPSNRQGDLWKGGVQAETNTAQPNTARLKQFRNATDLTSLSAILDIESSLTTWGAEALLNDSDGYYGGSHNFYLYDQGGAGFVFLPQDTDSDLDWLGLFGKVESTDHPIYWWYARAQPAPTPGDKWLIVLGDASSRVHYADAIAGLLAKWNVTAIQGWIDAWSQQIAAAATSDPHVWASPAEIQTATQTARRVVSERPVYLQSFVDCEHGTAGTATDADGDGYDWCDECDDGNPNVHPGAKEICGNGIDDDCNGFVDDGC